MARYEVLRSDGGLEFVRLETTGADLYYACLASDNNIHSLSTQHWPALDQVMPRTAWQRVLAELIAEAVGTYQDGESEQSL